VEYFRFTPPASGVYSITTCGTVGFPIRMAVLAGCSPKDGVLGCNDGICAPDVPYGGRVIGVALEAGTEYVILAGGVYGGASGTGQFKISLAEQCAPPPATIFESEACGENLNAGCEASGQPAEAIALGDVVHGTLWAADGARDTDWYALELVEGTEVKLALHADFDASATFYFADCTTSLFMDRTGYGCGSATDGICLPAGLHYLAVVPDQFWNHPCGYAGGNGYALSVTGTPCDASPPPNDDCDDAIVATEGATPFDNLFANTNVPFEVCPAPVLKDVWFTFTAAEAGDHWIYVCGSPEPFNTGMDLWTDCPDNGGWFIACNDDAADPACDAYGVSSSIVLPMTAGQTVWIRIGSTLFFDAIPGAADLVIESLGTETVCGDPDAGDCCATRATPYCSDVYCCNSVCRWDPTCCAAAWDQTCAGIASLWCYNFDGCATQPPNDECSAAAEATVGSNPFRNVQATGSVVTTCGTIYSEVWFEYVATSAAPATISFCPSDGGWASVAGDNGALDTVVAVFDACGGTQVACSNNACGTRSRVTFTPECGATYLIAIGSRTETDGIYSQGIGEFTITHPGNCGADCPADLTGDGNVAADDLAALLAAWGTPKADVDGDGTTGALDLAALLAAWGACGQES